MVTPGTDKREKLLSLSEKGQQLFEDINACITPIQEDLIHQSNISNDDLDHVIAIMKNYIPHYRRRIFMNQTSTTKQPIFTKSFTINFMINFFVYLCMYLLLVIIADYSKTSYHVSDSLSGLVVGLFIIGSLIGRFGTGKYVNRFGPKRF